MEILNILQAIVTDWWLLVIAFGAGGFYLQGKHWFHGVNQSLAQANATRDAHTKQANEILVMLRDMQRDVTELRSTTGAVASKLSIHEQELIRNTEQHSAIVKALETHVSDNREHDQSVKASLAVILDRLGK